MKRGGLITTVAVLHLLDGLLLASLAIYVLALTRSSEILKEADAADTVHGLIVGSIALGIPALMLLAAVWGLWKVKLWGWWLGLFTDIGLFGALAYNLMTDNTVDAGDITVTVCFGVFPLLLLLPKVRKFYWRANEAASASAAAID